MHRQSQAELEGPGMEIQRYARILNQRKMVVLLTAILTLVVVAFGSYQMTPIYTASSLLRVAQPTSTSVSGSDLNYGQRLIETYVQVLKSRPFLEETRTRLGLSLNPDDLVNIIQIDALPDTELIRISVDYSDPSQAAAIANTLGGLLVEQGQKIYTGGGKDARQILLDQLTAVEAQLAEDRAAVAPLASVTPEPAEASNLSAKIRAEEQTYSMLLSLYEQTRVEAALRANSISVVEPAVVPAVPSKPNVKRNLALAVVVGLMAGIGLALMLEGLVATIHSSDELRALTKLDLVGRIPRLQLGRRPRASGRSPVMAVDTASAMEAFHALAASILSRCAGTGPHTVLITSAEPGAGKSTITTNLSAALAQIGQQVIIVDGDQRSPCLHTVYRLPLAPGLADSVLDRSVLQRYLHATPFPGLRALTSGSPSVDHAAFWHSAALSEAVHQLTAQADVVLWDTPPLLVAVDATLLAPFADLVLLVVAEDQTTVRQLNLAVEQLRKSTNGALGIIYNKTKDGDYGYLYHYVGYKTRSKKAGRGSATQGASIPLGQGA
jgi:capsular exopolysaccharide synthesis family protein